MLTLTYQIKYLNKINHVTIELYLTISLSHTHKYTLMYTVYTDIIQKYFKMLFLIQTFSKQQLVSLLTKIILYDFYSVGRVHTELAEDTKKTVELIETIERQSVHLYHAEPPIDMPFIPPNISMVQKAGYLMHRRLVLFFMLLPLSPSIICLMHHN